MYRFLLVAICVALTAVGCSDDGPNNTINELPELPGPRDTRDGNDIDLLDEDGLSDAGDQDDADTCTGCPDYELIECGESPIPDLAAAHWVSSQYIAIAGELDDAARYELWIADCGLNPADPDTAERTLALTNANGLPDPQSDRFPHLAEFTALTVPSLTPDELDEAVRGQLLLVAIDDSGDLVASSRVQIAGLLDDRYSVSAPLGPHFDSDATSISVWAPTARWVQLRLYLPDNQAEFAVVPMERDESGVWTARQPEGKTWAGLLYRFEVYAYDDLLAGYPNELQGRLVTDPMSTALSINSEYSALVDLQDPETMPGGWPSLAPPGASPTDSVIYELHIRDFSASDPTVLDQNRGRYAAFHSSGSELSEGLAHLQSLADAGVTHVQLLPAFDFATVDEEPENRVDLSDPFSALCAVEPRVPPADCQALGDTPIRSVLESFAESSAEQQRITGLLAPHDSFNWGYDPLHFGVPEGSYATSPHGANRILEFRAMIQGLAGLGLGVSLDMVFNHTHASGRARNSVLDRIVPGYYHRRDPISGDVLTSTCCQNTATEHTMMRKLMVDLVVRWAVEYKVQGFRFDLMGHHMVADMQAVRAALDALNPEDDGVDGSSILLYGEGWDFGEVADNARGVNATQLNLAGSGLGTFNDRIRDVLRGGGPFDTGAALRFQQGIANGLHVDRNALAPAGVASRRALQASTDRLRASLAGNLQAVVFEDTAGRLVAGGNLWVRGTLDPNLADVGYALTPADSIQYVAAHDNQTLWDIQQLKLPSGLSTSARVRMQNLANSIVLLSQGIPMIHAGQELLRSKSMARDSYDAGDWFNALRFSGTDNNQQVGLPPEEDDGANWTIILSVFADPTTDIGSVSIPRAAQHLREMLQVRMSSPLFRLSTTDDVERRLRFLQSSSEWQPGVLAWSITDGDCAGTDLDPAYDGVVAVVNTSPDPVTIQVPGTTGFELHPVLIGSSDATVQQAVHVPGQFTVPGRTTAVFVTPDDTNGGGLSCNPHRIADIGELPTAPLFIRGTMNGWEAPDWAALTVRSSAPDVASVDIYLEAGSYELKLATRDWSEVDLGGGQPSVNGPAVTLQSGGDNATLTIPADGTYRFSIDLADLPSSAQLTVLSPP